MLNLAAVVFYSGHRARRGLATAFIGSIFLLAGVAGSASALEGIDLSSPAVEAAEGECPRLIQIKYPFLSCTSGQIGLADADENWDNSRRIPIQSDWIEGDTVWGPDLNMN
jgi:hypothetical protein